MGRTWPSRSAHPGPQLLWVPSWQKRGLLGLHPSPNSWRPWEKHLHFRGFSSLICKKKWKGVRQVCGGGEWAVSARCTSDSSINHILVFTLLDLDETVVGETEKQMKNHCKVWRQSSYYFWMDWVWGMQISQGTPRFLS